MVDLYNLKLWMRVQTQAKILVCLILASICLVSTVKALGVGPLHLDLTVEKGKETEFVQYIQVINSAKNPIHVVTSLSGTISEFITVEPEEFDMPAGPGAHSMEPSPYKDVVVTFKIPRELPEKKYSGQILFTEQPTTGGVLGTSVQLGVNVDLNIGEVAEAVFPLYVTALMVVLVILLISSVAVQIMRR